MPLYDLAVRREGIVIATGGQVEFLCLHPAARPEVLVGLGEVVGPGADCDTGADTAVDKVHWLGEDPGLIDVVNSELGV